ncbi:MAG: hypothetical protein ACLGI6_05425 [Gammaproteobacteria bacterium]
MKSRLERNGWYVGLTSVLSALLTVPLLKYAGVPDSGGQARFIVFFFCFAGIQRALSLLGWLLVMLVAPANKVVREHD